MSCPTCGRGKPKRACPALTQTICPTCCATKRLNEIQCPPDCGYLSTSREHPAAVVRRQEEQDMAILLPTIRTLTERQHQLYFLVLSVIARERAEGFGRFVDDDVAEAAGALAATLETARRGLIYEHAPQSLLAQRLVMAMKGLLDQLRTQTRVYEGELAIVLRAIEQAAKETRKVEGSDTAFLALARRLLRQTQAPAAQETPASSLILPGT